MLRFRQVPSQWPVQSLAALLTLWQEQHADNPAARQLEARWRAALLDKTISLEKLDADFPIVHAGSEGHETMRKLDPVHDNAEHTDAYADDFPHTFVVGSSEHVAWLAARATL